MATRSGYLPAWVDGLVITGIAGFSVPELAAEFRVLDPGRAAEVVGRAAAPVPEVARG